MSTKPTDREVRRRRTASEARLQALAAGRRLLLAAGPQALTLKAVGAEIGMTHANLIHHFGSAEAFQDTLRTQMVEDLTHSVAVTIERQDGGDAAAIVDAVFDAYGNGGIGHLMAWSALHRIGDGQHQGPIDAVRMLLGIIEPNVEGDQRAQRARALVALVTALALAGSLIGDDLASILGEERGMRRLTTALVEAVSCSETVLGSKT